MANLEVDGASLYYEVVGDGPMLLCISGADGTATTWKGFAEAVKENFTVVMYDRRGFSRSALTGSQDYAHRLETDADDAAKLIDHFSPNAPATVIGNSSGAIVALKLLTRHPQKISRLVAYEPPIYSILPDHEALHALQLETYDLYRRHGVLPAMEKFLDVVKSESKGMASMLSDSRRSPYASSNIQYWFEREFLVYPPSELDVERDLRPLVDKLMLINGQRTDKTAQQCRTNILMAEKLALPLHIVPGEHVGHITDAAEFGKALLELLEKRVM